MQGMQPQEAYEMTSSRRVIGGWNSRVSVAMYISFKLGFEGVRDVPGIQSHDSANFKRLDGSTKLNVAPKWSSTKIWSGSLLYLQQTNYPRWQYKRSIHGLQWKIWALWPSLN
jgi:hypothetical protein